MALSSNDYAPMLCACAHGDVKAFQALYSAEAANMLAVVQCMLENSEHSEDVVHDALLLAWNNAYRYPSDNTNARDWLYGILASRLYNQLKALEKTTQAVEAALLSSISPRTDNHASIVASITSDMESNTPGRQIRDGHALATLVERLPASLLSPRLIARLNQSVAYTLPSKQTLKTAEGESVYPPLYDPSLRWSMTRARLQYLVRESFKTAIGQPIEERLFRRWLRQAPRSQRIESMGLPRRSVESYGGDKLNLRLDPNRLITSISFPDKIERRKFSNQFLWKGDWDQRKHDIRTSSRYVFIDDIWRHRLNPEHSDFYQRQLKKIKQGRPYRSHHKGILLDTPERVLAYIHVYLFYMEDMACFGFDESQGKDRVGIAINREGYIVKINKGLHRLAMAQVLGVREISVHVRAVHQDWWQRITRGAHGQQALSRLFDALPTCQPA
ncbi:sigma factor [Phytohalomonas tamaricis]|uniref:sigma factor n=1 Tax=Phytohalomonas tamaricis TaxID=2081032 RepID=UPI000D0B2197|nr:sigma factor [Phytohalomonas tamaricis]